MKFLCVVLLVISLIAVGSAGLVCQADLECKLANGEFCFCLKGQYEQLGQCVCNMDPKYLNECTEDSDCKSKERGQKIRTICKCRRENFRQAKGQCDCNYALLG